MNLQFSKVQGPRRSSSYPVIFDFVVVLVGEPFRVLKTGLTHPKSFDLRKESLSLPTLI